MHSSFSDWYRAIKIKTDPEELKRRWQVVEALSQSLRLQDALELLRITASMPKRNQSYQNDLAKQIQEIDATFSIKNSQFEQAILSGATLIQTLSSGESQLGDIVGLAVMAANCQGLIEAKQSFQSELQEAAVLYLGSRTKSLRTSSPSDFDGEEIQGLQDAVNTFLSTSGWQESPLKTNFREIFELLNRELEARSRRVEWLEDQLQILREETNILWWLHGEHSRDLNQPISELGVEAAAIVTAKELADLITIRPGPRSAQAFLYRMLQKAAVPKRSKKNADTLTLRSAVNATPREWREQWISNLGADAVIDLCHVHHAVKKSLEVAEGKAWAGLFDAAAPIKATQKFSPLELAMQVYQEAQLIAEVNG